VIKDLIMNNIVSYDNEKLIIVDLYDNEIGTLNKFECHQKNGVLHRAFSIFLFNEQGQLLVQKRSIQKKLWPSFWSNSCCSHPRQGEDILEAAKRRLNDELGLGEVKLEFVYKFSYEAAYKDIGSENELCSVFLGVIDQKVNFNSNEIDEIRYINTSDLLSDMDARTDYTPWFIMEWKTLTSQYTNELKSFLS